MLKTKIKKKNVVVGMPPFPLSHSHLLGMPCFRRKLNKPSSWRSPLCTSPPSSWSPSTETSSSRPRAAPRPPRLPAPTPARPAAPTGTARMEVSRGCGGMGDEDAGVAMVTVFRLWSWWWVSIEMKWGCWGCYGDGAACGTHPGLRLWLLKRNCISVDKFLSSVIHTKPLGEKISSLFIIQVNCGIWHGKYRKTSNKDVP